MEAKGPQGWQEPPQYTSPFLKWWGEAFHDGILPPNNFGFVGSLDPNLSAGCDQKTHIASPAGHQAPPNGCDSSSRRKCPEDAAVETAGALTLWPSGCRINRRTRSVTRASALLVATLVATSYVGGVSAQQMRSKDLGVLKDMVARWAPVGWEIEQDPCSWPGITCGTVKEGIFMPAEKSFVRSIMLSRTCAGAEDKGLSCVIPDSIGRLDLVEALFLAGNGFVGHIPNTLSGLTSLRALYLNANRLAGPIPPSLGALKKLEKLHLNHNILSGHIPPELCGATSLHQLELQQNELSGPIPGEIAQLRELVQLDLSGNELEGEILVELQGLKNLHRLSLQGNMLTGSIPEHILSSSMENLMKVDLRHNELTGPLPYSVCQMRRLVMLRVTEGNDLQGVVVDCEAPHGLHNDAENRKDCVERLKTFCDQELPVGLHDEL